MLGVHFWQNEMMCRSDWSSCHKMETTKKKPVESTNKWLNWTRFNFLLSVASFFILNQLLAMNGISQCIKHWTTFGIKSRCASIQIIQFNLRYIRFYFQFQKLFARTSRAPHPAHFKCHPFPLRFFVCKCQIK